MKYKFCRCSECGRVIPFNPEFIQTSGGSGRNYVSYPHAIVDEPCNHQYCNGCFDLPDNCVSEKEYLKYAKKHPDHAEEDKKRLGVSKI